MKNSSLIYIFHMRSDHIHCKVSDRITSAQLYHYDRYSGLKLGRHICGLLLTLIVHLQKNLNIPFNKMNATNQVDQQRDVQSVNDDDVEGETFLKIICYI